MSKSRYNGITIPEEIRPFYYWVCENKGIAEANDTLDNYMDFLKSKPSSKDK